ncbi:bifunctional biotin--[acetyl-CoA-carboxylase] ligase/biotin operon repressor BirA [Arsenophonus symbiont of Ornithomya chloropus]|uniref:bifunctional biotin--[acetyl-CoA-carboxylase] ligase/biotin operon repressor BirA n=1 Tax=Arsenophonus symbiont of Ornithomya chloropus TaxID=634121 RepID=UPI0032B13183
MKDLDISLELIKILSDGSIHLGDNLIQVFGLTFVDFNKHINILRRLGVEVNIINNDLYQITKKIDLLDYKKIYSLVKKGKIFVKSVLNSTNQYLLDYLDYVDQLKSGDACVAEYQIAGRGRYGRNWISPFGCNLYLSLYWYLEDTRTSIVGLSLVVAIVIAETLNQLIGSNIKVKWPNDLYLNEKKLAGILIEMKSKIRYMVDIIIGIGINISMSRTHGKKINQNWINLERSGIKIEKNIIAGKLIVVLRNELLIFEKYGFAPFIERWLALDNFLDKKVKLRIGNRDEIGIVKGVNQNGAILLKQNGEIFSYCGEIISLSSGDKFY